MKKYLGYRIKEYVRYRLRAQSIHKIHSPFVFDFYNKVLKTKYINDDIEELRKSLYKNRNTIEVEDLGAGSVTGALKCRKISDIAKNAVKAPVYASILYNIVEKYQPEDVVELGTSLGLTSMYLQMATDKPIFTLEGSSNILKQAKENLSTFEELRPKTILGNFDQTFPEVFRKLSGTYLIYIDGNHTYDATMRYFEIILENPKQGSIIVFDDIYWSPEMTRAWKEIKSNAQVDLSIDLYQLGIVFFNADFKEKQDFTLPVYHIGV